MKFIITLIALCFSSYIALAQIEEEKYREIADTFEQKYNAGDYTGIFQLFSSNMQNHLPETETIRFLTDLEQQAGKLKAKEFIGFNKESFASYKGSFEKALLSINIALNEASSIAGLYIAPYEEPEETAIMERNLTQLILPFHEEWTVVWGGDTKDLNYHVESKAQKNAFDLVITNENGKSYQTDGSTNEDYYAFGKELIAPADGEVVLVVDGVKDNVPGELNPLYIPGNTVIIKTANDEYLFFAHFKQHSIAVKQGQQVQQGDLLGRCGNSGNSSEPHLHFHIQHVEDMTNATGIKCYFDEIVVNGAIKTDYSPVQDDKIGNQ